MTLIEKGFLKPLLKIASGASIAIESAKEEQQQNNNNNALMEIASSVLSLQTILYGTSSTEEIANTCVEYLLDLNAIPRLVELIMDLPPDSSRFTNSTKKIINTTLSILANLTRTERGAIELVGTTLPEEAVYNNDTIDDEEKRQESTNDEDGVNNNDDDKHVRIKPSMELLLDRFMNNGYNPGNNSDDDVVDLSVLEPNEWDTALYPYDPYQHFASLLMNATQVKGGRRFVTRIPRSKINVPTKSILQKLLPTLRENVHQNSYNPFRRRGISGMIRNIILDPETGKDNAWWLLNICGVLTPLLMPLMGPEELSYDEKKGMDPDLWLDSSSSLSGQQRQRDYDEITRLYCVESILALLATGRQSRKYIRNAQTYTVLKICDLSEDSELISDRIAECVNFLRRDEEGAKVGSSDEQIYGTDTTTTDTTKAVSGLLEAGPSPSVQIKVDDDENFDDVD